jgi:dienelactone hydrolase
MLRNHIERRERRWHQRDTNRFPRPFEWGLEHVGLEREADPLSALLRYSDEAVSSSERFYQPPPGAGFELDGETLRFPSALETPDLVNNTVWGRYFPAGGSSAVILLPQWNAQPESHMGLARLLQRLGVSALRLSLPYHDRRRPAHLERAEYLVGPNLGRTLAATRQAVLDVRRAADWLEARGYARLGLLGTSIGSCVGFLALAHDPRFGRAAFIHVSSHFADVVWHGLSTGHVRASLEEAIGLEDLRRIWAPISPYPFIPRLREVPLRMLVLAGRYDLSFPFDLTALSLEAFRHHRIPHESAILPCGHYTMAHFPFNAVAGFWIGKFFRTFR